MTGVSFVKVDQSANENGRINNAYFVYFIE